MNKNYNIGRQLEYDVMNVLKTYLPKNCGVYRSAGSHSEADLLVVQNRIALKVQCKSQKVKPSLVRSAVDARLNSIITEVKSMKLDGNMRGVDCACLPRSLKISYFHYNRALDDVVNLLKRSKNVL